MEKTKSKSKVLILGAGIILGIVLIVISVVAFNKGNQNEKNVVTTSSLQKIIKVRRLSTSTAVYNGIAKVKNEKKSDKIDYYVAYEAKVSAGIDFDKVDIVVDHEAKKVSIKIPDVYITDVVVDVSSMDFIFNDKSANKSAVTEKAFKACEEDAETESKEQNAILELAQQNAVNAITALVKPFIEQMDKEYTLIVE